MRRLISRILTRSVTCIRWVDWWTGWRCIYQWIVLMIGVFLPIWSVTMRVTFLWLAFVIGVI